MKNKINKKYIKELIVNYFNSTDIEIVFIYEYLYLFDEYSYSKSIKMNNLIDYYLTEYGYYYDVSEIKNIDVFELIKIFLNIFYNSKSIFTKYKNYYIKNMLDLSIDKNKIKFKFNEIDKKIFNIVNEFLKRFNIKIVRNNKFIDLNISNTLFFNKNDKEEPIQTIINKYWNIKNRSDRHSIEHKFTYMCRLKNELDELVRCGVINNKFLTLNKAKFRLHMQSLFSHRGGKYKSNEEFEKIKKCYDSSNNQDKNKIINELFDALILIYSYNKILN